MTDYTLETTNARGRGVEPAGASGLAHSAANGALFLRLVLVGYWLIHWWFKVGFRGMTATETFFGSLGLPGWLAWFDISIELVFAALLLTGRFYRFATIASLPIVVASIIIYGGNGFYFPTGGIELPLLWALIQVAACLIGPGALSIQSPFSRRKDVIGWWAL
jgi:putative oxidoreductase